MNLKREGGVDMGFMFIDGKRVHTSCINNEVKMERKVGDVFEHDGVNLEVVGVGEDDSCNGCYFDTSEFGCVHDHFVNNIHSCYYEDRDDNTSVIFKEVE